MPDLAIATLNDFVEAGAMHASLDPTVPVIADADTGYVIPRHIWNVLTDINNVASVALLWLPAPSRNTFALALLLATLRTRFRPSVAAI